MPSPLNRWLKVSCAAFCHLLADRTFGNYPAFSFFGAQLLISGLHPALPCQCYAFTGELVANGQPFEPPRGGKDQVVAPHLVDLRGTLALAACLCAAQTAFFVLLALHRRPSCLQSLSKRLRLACLPAAIACAPCASPHANTWWQTGAVLPPGLRPYRSGGRRSAGWSAAVHFGRLDQSRWFQSFHSWLSFQVTHDGAWLVIGVLVALAACQSADVRAAALST